MHISQRSVGRVLCRTARAFLCFVSVIAVAGDNRVAMMEDAWGVTEEKVEKVGVKARLEEGGSGQL